MNYMAVRASDHGSKGFEYFIRAFAWARNNVEYPGCEQLYDDPRSKAIY